VSGERSWLAHSTFCYGHGLYESPICAHRPTAINAPSKLACFIAPFRAIRRFPGELGLVDPRLRASNEHSFTVRVPRAGGQPGHVPLPLQARSYPLQEGGLNRSPTARIEGAHSDRAASASTGDQSGLPLFSSSTTSVTIIHQSHHLH
jgi:hypothetical protein